MRWKRLIRCAGGLRCANTVATNLDEVPPGMIVHLEYTCGGCGTHYAWDSKTERRRVIDHPSKPGGGTTIGPGETATFETFDPRRN